MNDYLAFYRGRRVMITGGMGFIGSNLARLLVDAGAQILIVDALDPDYGGNQFNISGIEEYVRLNVADVRDVQALRNMVEATVAKWGRVDCLVNNAGIVMDAQIKNMTEDQFDKVIEINLKGVYNCTKAVVDTMLKQQSGVILNASSIVGLYGNFGQTNYAASKFGVIGMMKTWARELGRKGIRANAVCPGFIATSILGSIPERVLRALEEKVPMGRLGKPEEVASTFAFLASDEASYINGAVIEVSGGLTI